MAKTKTKKSAEVVKERRVMQTMAERLPLYKQIKLAATVMDMTVIEILNESMSMWLNKYWTKVFK